MEGISIRHQDGEKREEVKTTPITFYKINKKRIFLWICTEENEEVVFTNRKGWVIHELSFGLFEEIYTLRTSFEGFVIIMRHRPKKAPTGSYAWVENKLIAVIKFSDMKQYFLPRNLKKFRGAIDCLLH